MSIRRDELIGKMIALQANRKSNVFINQEEYKLFCVMLADEGWYIDYDLAVRTLSNLYIYQIKTDSRVLDEYMIKHYKNKLGEVIRFFREKHQIRYFILEKAFKAHKKGDYELSIPVFLTQIEGLFYDLTQKEIFSKGKGKNKDNAAREWLISKEKENHNLAFRLSFLEPLKENENISANFKESEGYPNSLNRNKILHGRDLSYPSELNSYKAISLLLFIGTIVYDVVNNSNEISRI